MAIIKKDATKEIQHIIIREEGNVESCQDAISMCLEKMENIIKQAKKANAKGCFTMGEAELLHKKVDEMEWGNRNWQNAAMTIRMVANLLEEEA